MADDVMGVSGNGRCAALAGWALVLFASAASAGLRTAPAIPATTPFAPPSAEFGVSRTSGLAPLTVDFTDLSSGSVTSWSWSFGDGGTATEPSPTHVFAAAGTYTVSLTVAGPEGSDTRTKQDFIVAVEPTPVAGWTASSTRGGPPLTVAFEDASTGSVTTRLWSFGDGATSFEVSPVHVYESLGTYTVSLLVLGPGGFDRREEVGAIVVELPPPAADFTAVATSGRAPLTVAFSDRSTGTVTDHLWSFGDGTSSTERDPVHVYRTPGTYGVSLTVSGAAGEDTRHAPSLVRVRGEETRIHLRAPSYPSFVLRATVPVEKRPFDRRACPFTVFDPDGRPLPTQWELVARTTRHLIVELLAPVANRWSGEVTFEVRETNASTPFSLAGFDPDALSLIWTPGAVQVRVEDQQGGVESHSIAALGPGSELHRHGPVAITVGNHTDLGHGWMHAWTTVHAGSREVELILNWHDGGLPARPDVYVRSLALDLPPGWTWTPLLPDPAAAPPYLVAPDDHVLPQRMERTFRVVIHPAGTTPSASLEAAGFGVGDWSEGGYLAQDVALPDLGHVPIELGPERGHAYALLRDNLPTEPGSPPVSPLWPAQGVYYGGMTGGIDVEQVPGVELAVSGDPDGLLSAFVEEMRYGARHLGCIYEVDGHPVRSDDHLLPDGSTPWDLFNNRFQGSPAHDEPFGFSRTGPGDGVAAYDPSLFDPIDDQHLVRRTKANKVLAWLANDPLARLHLTMDAELARMTFHEGPNGRLGLPSSAGMGTEVGRAEAWAADVMAHTWAISGNGWRARNRAWFERFVGVLEAAQMPNGLFSARRTGKTATAAPYGDGTHAYFWVHRSNEQVFLMHALVGIERTVGLPTAALVRGAGEGLWNLAWKPGASGPLGRYPAGPIGGERYVTRAEIPAGLTTSEGADPFQVGNGLAWGQVSGATLYPAILRYTGAATIDEAIERLEQRGTDNVENWIVLLDVLRRTIEPPHPQDADPTAVSSRR